MPPCTRPRLWRIGTALPAVLITVVGVAAATSAPQAAPSTHARSSSAPAHYRTVGYSDGAPIGRFEHARQVRGGLRVSGWDFDPNSPKSAVRTYVTIDGHWVNSKVDADKPRADVAAAHPRAGAAHGFGWRVAVPQGKHAVCVLAKNIGPHGYNATLGCVTRNFDYNPTGYVDPLVDQAGKLHVSGWAYDPDSPKAALKVSIAVDSAAPRTVLANDPRKHLAQAHPSAGSMHGFDQLVPLAEGRHRVCVTALNVYEGANSVLECTNVTVDFTPTASLSALSTKATGVMASGWASDPDTSAPISTNITVDGARVKTISANRAGHAHDATRGHRFSTFLPMHSGTHTVCAIGLNVDYGTHNSTPSCRTVTLALSPLGHVDSIVRAANGLTVTGWALDPDTTAPITVAVTLDGAPAGTITANLKRSDVAHKYPLLGADHGYSAVVPTDAGEHTVCLTASNVGGGHDLALGCTTVNAVHPAVPEAPRAVTAVAGYGGAVIGWSAPAFDGGAPVTSYIVTAAPGGATSTVSSRSRTATITGLQSKTAYTFSVSARNVTGTSVGAVSPQVTTTSGPPAQRTPAPVSTSRYIRNLSGSSAHELAMMRAEGAADGASNPSGHGYFVLLDIGGQDQYDRGVVLTATTRFVGYDDLLRDLDAYVDGYHSAQHSSAPVTIALGTNNDMDVNSTTGAVWADSVVDPVRYHSRKYLGVTIAGADDIEPGFRATYRQTKSWLGGYLKAAHAPFVFNGSADGCAWTYTNGRCNNGWTMAGLQYLASGAAPTRMLNLPQIYNNTMAEQWKYISLTGVVNGSSRINFAGTLTEVTACRQAGGCGSLSAHSAWKQLWADLQSDRRVRVASLPYSTDLRIDW